MPPTPHPTTAWCPMPTLRSGWQRTCRCSIVRTTRSRRSTTSAGGRFVSTSSKRPQGLVLTEFLRPVNHAGPYNTVSCAVGHHVAEGRWLRDQRPLDEYFDFWFRSGPNGTPGRRTFTSTAVGSRRRLYNRYLVTNDRDFLIDLLDDLVADYKLWESERRRDDGLFWQYDVRDGMEESISGSRVKKNIRPTINSYMAANALAIAQIAALAGRSEIANAFNEKHDSLQQQIDRRAVGRRCEVLQSALGGRRTFRCPRSDRFHSVDVQPAWPGARRGVETDNRPGWLLCATRPDDGRATPPGRFALTALAPASGTVPSGRSPRAKRSPDWPTSCADQQQQVVTRQDYFDALQTYAYAHQMNGRPYIGEYHDEMTGDWLITGPKAARSRDYNHSTFCDLVISGLVGLVPRADETVEIRSARTGRRVGLVLPRRRPLPRPLADDHLGSHRRALWSWPWPIALGGWPRDRTVRFTKAP